MNKSRIIGTILALATAFAGNEGYEFAIENYGETEIVMPDGTTYEAKDITRHPTKVFSKRNLDNVKGIVWHHAAWETQDIEKIASWHVNGNNWAGIGYHGAIKKDGTYLVLNDLETLSYHAKGSNSKYVGIVFMSNADETELTPNQLKTAKYILEAFCQEMKIEESIGHRDTKGASTKCPGDIGYKQLSENEIFF